MYTKFGCGNVLKIACLESRVKGGNSNLKYTLGRWILVG